MGRVRSTINARLEETSFRAGVTASAGVLAVAGGAIALAVTLGGNHAEAAPKTAPRIVPHTPAPTVTVTPSPSPVKASAKPKPEHKAPATSAAVPAEAAVYSPPPSPEHWGYQGRHRRAHGGWPGQGGGGSWGHFGHHGGGPHYP